LSIGQLIDRSGFAHQTVYNHLNHLTTAGLASKEVVGRSCGRPTISYSLSKHMAGGVVGRRELNVPETEACRFEEGGWCEEAKGTCTAERCPLIIRIKSILVYFCDEWLCKLKHRRPPCN
jgi:DNA-binding transcriptional ArsR family regulator